MFLVYMSRLRMGTGFDDVCGKEQQNFRCSLRPDIIGNTKQPAGSTALSKESDVGGAGVDPDLRLPLSCAARLIFLPYCQLRCRRPFSFPKIVQVY